MFDERMKETERRVYRPDDAEASAPAWPPPHDQIARMRELFPSYYSKPKTEEEEEES